MNRPTNNPFQLPNMPNMSNMMQGMPNMMTGMPNLMQAYFGGMDTMTQSTDPYFKGIARLQLEAMGLMSRRAQAYLEIPSRLSQCRTPQDLFSEQMRFWQTAFQQYTESSRKMLAASNQMMVMPPTVTQALGGGKPAKRERDYINVPEAKAPQGPQAFPQPPTPGRERRVA